MWFDLVLLVYLTYKNSVRAKQKAQNAIVWSVITVVSVLVAYFIGAFFVVVTFFAHNVNVAQFNSTDKKATDALMQQMSQAFATNPLHLITIEAFGLGGYLLIRYILNRMPDKKEPEIHWMDRINDVNR